MHSNETLSLYPVTFSPFFRKEINSYLFITCKNLILKKMISVVLSIL